MRRCPQNRCPSHIGEKRAPLWPTKSPTHTSHSRHTPRFPLPMCVDHLHQPTKIIHKVVTHRPFPVACVCVCVCGYNDDDDDHGGSLTRSGGIYIYIWYEVNKEVMYRHEATKEMEREDELNAWESGSKVKRMRQDERSWKGKKKKREGREKRYEKMEMKMKVVRMEIKKIMIKLKQSL